MRAESRIALILVVCLLGGLGFFVQQKLQSQTNPATDDDLAEFLEPEIDDAQSTPANEGDESQDELATDDTPRALFSSEEFVPPRESSTAVESAGSSAASPNPWSSQSATNNASDSTSDAIVWAETDTTPVSGNAPAGGNPFAAAPTEPAREFQPSDLIAQPSEAPAATSSNAGTQTPVADPFAGNNPFGSSSPVTTAGAEQTPSSQRPAQPVFYQTPIPPTQNSGADEEAESPTNPFEAQDDAPSANIDSDPFAPVQATPAPVTGLSSSTPTFNFSSPPTTTQSPTQSTPAPALSPTPNPFSTTSGGSFAQPAYNPQGLSDAPGGDPGTKIYEVAPGDNYWTISRKVYGAGRYFSALAEYNKPRIENPELLAPGMIVLIPTPELLDQRYAEIISSPLPGEGGTAPAGFFVDAAGQPMYRVGEADTLSGIAQSCLGRSSRWVQLYGMNRDVIGNADALRPGTVLRLPADAAPVALGPEETVIR